MSWSVESDGVPIRFLDEGRGEPALLIHGFASNARVNWVSTGWVRDLLAAGRRVIAFDNRGHGESGKPHDPAQYGFGRMAADALRVLEALAIARADVIGYSMGARIAASLALQHPECVRSAVLGGVGDQMLVGRAFTPIEPLVEALRAPSLDAVTDARGRTYRLFADQTGSDREALAACVLGATDSLTPADLQRIAVPVLVATGSEDHGVGSGGRLADLIPGAEFFEIPGRDHMKAVGDRAHKAAVLAFLERQDGR